MSKSTMKMLGLALMMASIFAIEFGMHATEAGVPAFVGSLLVVSGLAALLAGTILYAVVRKD